MIDRRTFLRSTAGAAALAGLGTADIATGGPAVGEQDPFLAMLNDYRDYLDAYGAAPFQTAAEEQAWCEANYPATADILFTNPPAITTDDGALEAIRYVAQSDLVELDPAYARMLTMAAAHLEKKVA